eukprot:356051-Chlamydomonas_euryale.AAC.2
MREIGTREGLFVRDCGRQAYLTAATWLLLVSDVATRAAAVAREDGVWWQWRCVVLLRLWGHGGQIGCGATCSPPSPFSFRAQQPRRRQGVHGKGHGCVHLELWNWTKLKKGEQWKVGCSHQHNIRVKIAEERQPKSVEKALRGGIGWRCLACVPRVSSTCGSHLCGTIPVPVFEFDTEIRTCSPFEQICLAGKCSCG